MHAELAIQGSEEGTTGSKKRVYKYLKLNFRKFKAWFHKTN